jgi:REP element-mobilizing transposase RayT
VVNDGKMVLNTCGTIVQNVLESLPDHHPVILDENQILPNHVHFVLGISSPRKGVARYAPTLGIITAGSLPSIVRSFKSECSKLIHVESSNIRVWQRNYYEHIIRNEKELNQIRQYIQDNPMNWEKDEENI